MKTMTEEKRTVSGETSRKNNETNGRTKRGRANCRDFPAAVKRTTGKKTPARKDGATLPLKKRSPRSEINRQSIEKRRYPDPVFSGRDNSWGDRSDW